MYLAQVLLAEESYYNNNKRKYVIKEIIQLEKVFELVVARKFKGKEQTIQAANTINRKRVQDHVWDPIQVLWIHGRPRGFKGHFAISIVCPAVFMESSLERPFSSCSPNVYLKGQPIIRWPSRVTRRFSSSFMSWMQTCKQWSHLKSRISRNEMQSSWSSRCRSSATSLLKAEWSFCPSAIHLETI